MRHTTISVPETPETPEPRTLADMFNTRNEGGFFEVQSSRFNMSKYIVRVVQVRAGRFQAIDARSGNRMFNASSDEASEWVVLRQFQAHIELTEI